MHAGLARILYHGAQSLRGEPVTRILRELEESQHWSTDRLSALQWERKRAIARRAWETVPFYRERWGAGGFHPDALRTADDWDRLPILAKDDLRLHAATMRAGRAPAGLAAATSGSAGQPVAILRGHLSWAHAHANVLRGWHWHGVDAGDRYAYVWGVPLDAGARWKAQLKDAFFNRERLSAFAIDAASAREFHAGLRERPARFAFGYPSALDAFARELQALGLSGREFGWKVVITSAEVLHDHQRERIRDTFGCRVADSYGCAEAGIAGFECEAGGMHVPVESVAVDRVPADGGGEEILLTDLYNFAQPLIRYRVGDLVEPWSTGSGAESAGPACPCGRALPLLGRISGRAGDMLELPGGRRVNANLPSYVFKRHARAGTVHEYQFVQFPDGRIELRVIPGPAWADGMTGTLVSEVRGVLNVDVEVRPVERIARRGRAKHRDFVRAEDLGEEP
jgi:phenylacetate-CoA ligase